MSMTPSPGWYPDPSAPSTERWWDGAAWTEHRRTPRPPEPATAPTGFGPAQPGFGQAQPGFGPVEPPPGRTGRGKTVALAVSALVVVGAIVAGALVLDRGDGGSPTDVKGASDAPTPPDGKPSTAPSGPATPSPSPSGDPSVAVDDLDGITLPVLDGWTKPEIVVDDSIVLTTEGTYACPGDAGLCRHGQVGSSPVTSSDETSPKAVATKDISDAASHFYDHDALGSRPFRGIASHQRIAEGNVAVAGRAGYMVRWRVTTRVGPGGYVESLVFPSSVGSQSLVLVRFAFDAGPGGPALSQMDEITKGIRSVDDTTTGGGVGSSLGPSQ